MYPGQEQDDHCDAGRGEEGVQPHGGQERNLAQIVLNYSARDQSNFI